MNQKVIIWGASGHAKIVSGILQSNGDEIVGFFDDVNINRQGNRFCHSLIYNGNDDLLRFREAGIDKIFIGFGNNQQRVAKAEFVESLGFTLVNAIHPSAIVAADVSIGAGSLLAAGTIVNPGSTLGRLTIINTAATVDHDCVLEEGVHVGPGVRMAGNVRIGRCTWLGIGSTIIDNITVGSNSVVGAGAVVVEDVQDAVLVVGVPARIIKRFE